jgi:periplasmic protein TonB
MLETLLESKSKRERSVTGTIASVVTHTALVAGALYGTAQAHVLAAGPPERVRTVYFPQAQNHLPSARPTAVRPQHSASSRSLIFVDPHVEINLPPMDITDVVSRPSDFMPGPATVVGTGSPGESGRGSTDTPFRADQVERQVAVLPGSPTPRYPEVLRTSGVEGQVMAEFVVDEQGLMVEKSIRFLRSGNALFESAVRVALRRMRFVPAEVGGRKVKQLVQMPFVFTLAR